MPAQHFPTDQELQQHPVVSQEAWIAARTELLKKEKELTHLNEQHAADIRALPWIKIEKDYVFDTANGPKSLSDLFDGRTQLLVKHFMFGPDWEEGCVGCSFECDHLDATLQHLHHHDVTVVAVARAPVEKIEAFKKRMDWHFNWVSSGNNDFNFDFKVSFTPEEVAAGSAFYNYTRGPVPIDELSGFSVFYKARNGTIYHTYSTFGRGAEYLMGTYVVLDMTPKGRNENGPHFDLTDWVRHHDRYDAGGHVAPTGQYVPAPGSPCCSGDEEGRLK